MLRHIERERQQQEFNFEDVRELEGDLVKVNRWLCEAKERDFWEITARKEAEKLLSDAEIGLTLFTQKTYEWIQNLEAGNSTDTGVKKGET